MKGITHFDGASDDPEVHNTAREICPICGEELGYNVQVISRDGIWIHDSFSREEKIYKYSEDDHER